ncbi:MAG TPA: cadherin-like domain-containing protein, partial [Candidatus Saccharimonadales bacterium]|nr:cadherin-like domain-containing protein [Candidatus Saccharimonadales bacterium]
MANTRFPSSRRNGWTWIGLCLLLGPAFAHAQPAVLRDVTAAGGGAASGGPYAIVDTTGQAIAGSASSSIYAVEEEFWGTFGSAPIPYALVLTTLLDQPVQFPAATLLAGSDADGDAVSLVSISPSSAQGGVVALASNLVTYTPPQKFLGADSFTYTIIDTGGDTAVGAVSVNVLPVVFTVTTNAAAGPGSLRQALDEINAATTNEEWIIVLD